MWRHLALAALAIALHACIGAAARADDKFPCDAFVRLGDGSWQAVTTTLIPDRNFKVQEGSLWRPGATVMGMDIATTLDKECPNVAVLQPQQATAPGGPVQPQQSQLPQVPLTRYADANGNIDVRSLTCAHLDGTSPEEAELLLSWYSGWYNGSVKGHGINLARVRYAIHSVSEYCKANPDKSLVQVIELMLK